MDRPPPLSHTAGLLLAGGRSSRFGADKALTRLGNDLLMDRASRPLAALAALAISTKAGSAVAALACARNVTILTDDPNNPSGPLTGILSGLDWAHDLGFRFLASVPCDAPLLPLGLVPALLGGIGDAPAAYARTAEGEHPLCALWETNLRGRLRAILASGTHPSVRGFLSQVGARPVDFARAEAFANANTPQTLTELERWL